MHSRAFKGLHCLLAVLHRCTGDTCSIEEELCNLHIQLVVLCQQHMHALDKLNIGCLLLLLLARLLRSLFKRNAHSEGSANALFALHLQRSTHFINQALGYWHTKACALIRAACYIAVLRKGVEHVRQKALADTNACILTLELYEHSLVVSLSLDKRYIHPAIVLIIFDSIAHNVQQNALHMHRTANQAGIRQLVLFDDKLHALLLRLRRNNASHLIAELTQIEGNLLQHNLAGIELAHLQHLINKVEQKA